MAGPSLCILHLLAPAPFGGLESVVRALAREQATAGAKVAVGALVDPGEHAHPFVIALREDGSDVRVIEVPHRRYRFEREAVRALIERFAPSVLHIHGYRPDVVDGPLARRMGVARVSTVHGFVGDDLRDRFYGWLQLRSLRHADAVVAVSRPLVEDLVRSGIERARVRLIPNASVDVGAPLPRTQARSALRIDAKARVVGFVGRIGFEKGADVLVRAMADAHLRDAVACFVGTGGQEKAMRRLASTLGIEDRVLFRGRIADAGRLMAAFDVLALPSRTEGTPMVLFEASRAGLPVVGCAVGGVPDVLGRGFNVVPHDAPAALAAALARVLSSGRAAREVALRSAHLIRGAHAVGPWVARHLELYRSLAPATATARATATAPATAAAPAPRRASEAVS